jgi:xanthine dehydrogenase accessory factor
MKEFKAIIDAFDKIDFATQRAALATVVKVSGSSYRSPGARMLITDDGRWVGSISGGCLEGDALRKARNVMTTGAPVTITYDTREESNQSLGIGLGCNGVIDVLIEPATNDQLGAVNMFRKLVSENKLALIGTVFNGPSCIGNKLVIDSEGNAISSFSHPELSNRIESDLLRLLETRKTESRVYEINGVGHEVFLELVEPSIKLMIFGAGFDARPVSQMGKILGWEVEVTDECVSHIAPVFFPDADKLSLCAREFVDRDFHITPYTACVLMSHNYDYDRDVLRKLIATDAPYIGILGPRKRFEKMLLEYESEGLILTDEQRARIHSPIGLDIGAETPDEIALSIVSEIKSKFSHRSGGYLKYRIGPIHQRDPKNGSIFREIFINSHSGSHTTGA